MKFWATPVVAMTAMKDRARNIGSAREYPVALLMWIITLVAILPSLLLALYALDRWSSNEQQRERDLVASLARNLTQTLDRHLVALTDMVEVLAASRSLENGDLSTFDSAARDAAAGSKGDFVLIDRTMQQHINTRAPPGAPLPKAANVESLQKVFETRRALVTNLRIGATSPRPIIAINVPVMVTGEARYVLAFVPSAATFLEIVTDTYRPAGWMAAIIDGNGLLLARSERHEDFFGRPSNAFPRFEGENGILETTDLQGRPSVTAWHRSGASEWRTVVWVPKDILTAPRQSLHRIVVLLLIITCLISAISAWFVSYLIRLPTARVVAAARTLRRGQPLEYRPTIMREANIVAQEMAYASREIAERTADLEESEERMRRASEAAGFGVFDYRTSTDTVLWSASLARLFGLKDEAVELEGSKVAEQVFEQDRPQLAARWSQIIRKGGPFEFEFRIRRPDGSIRWLMERGEAIGPVDPTTGVVERVAGTILDITDRKQREEQISLLMREVNHRSKNTLGLVQAIARQTGGNSPDEFKHRFFDRLRALAAAQDLLINEGYTGLDIRDLLTSQLAHFADIVGQRVVAEGPALRLNAAASQCLGMAFHELATNAGKYGALSNDAGTVHVSWRTNGSQFDIRWIERGGPEVATPATRGFGTTVIGYMIKSSLKATVCVEYPAEGLEWSIVGPLEALIETGSS